MAWHLLPFEVLGRHTTVFRRRRAPDGVAMKTLIAAEPQPLAIALERTALLIIDMQRDFLEPGGFGETLGNDVSLLKAAVAPLQAVLAGGARGRPSGHPYPRRPPAGSLRRAAGQGRARRTVQAHRRAGSDGAHSHSRRAGARHHPRALSGRRRAGDRQAGQGRVLRDRSRSSSLKNCGIENLIVTGVTTEVCVNTTVREANDRGYRCVVLADCCASYFPEFHDMGLKMIKAQGGIFGWVSDSRKMLAAFAAAKGPKLVQGSRSMSTTTGFKPTLWTPGDWNAFFGFGTNILVNLLVLTGLLRFVLKMPDALVFGRILPALGLMMCLSTFYYAWLAYRLAQEDRPHRRLRAALGHQRAAHVHRHLRDHAADRAQDRRPGQRLGSGPGLGVLPELHADGRRLHRALSSA